MEAIAGLSIAANVMQVVAFTHETVSLWKKISKKQTIDPGLAERATRISNLADNLESKLSQSKNILNQSQNPSIKSSLPALCNDVVSTAKELGTRLNQPASSRREAVKLTFKAVFGGSSEISGLDRKLLQLEQTLQTELLSEIWSKQDAALIQQQQGFTAVDRSIKDLIQQHAQGQIGLQDVLRKEHIDAIARLSDELQSSWSIGFDKTIQHVTQIAESSERSQEMRRQKKQLLSSVRFTSRNARKAGIERAHEKTFEWIFDAPDDDDVHGHFRKWLVTDDKPIFWIQGKPGSGKSTLMKFLVSTKRTPELLESKYPEHVTYSHFIWMADKLVDGTSRGLLCSLIHQILEMDTNDYLVEILLQDHPEFLRRQSPLDYEMDELELILQKLLSSHRGFVVLFIDGLDELDASENKFRLKDFVEATLKKVANLKLCVSSRPEPEIKLLLGGYPSIELQNLTALDLETVARENLSKYFEFALRDISEDETNMLVRCILDKAEGVFLWITLSLTRLKRGSIACDTVDLLMKSLEDTPSELNDLYQKMWDRLGPDQKHYQKHAAFVFKCLLEWKELAFESDHMLAFHLTICRENGSGEMLHKLMTKRMDFFRSQECLTACMNNQKQVESHCAGLIEFIKDKKSYGRKSLVTHITNDDHRRLRVDFIHRSLRDFLLGDGQSLLDQQNVEDVFASILKAVIGETMINTKLDEAGFGHNTTGPYYNLLSKRKEEFDRFPLHTEVYMGCRRTIFLVKRHHLLDLALKCCRKWMRHSEQRGPENNVHANSWDLQSQYHLTLLATAFDTYEITTFLEAKAIHLGDVNPTIESPLATHPLSTYLIWSRLDPSGVRYFGYDRDGHPDDERNLKLLDLNWAFFHSIMAAFYTIPQLMTLPESAIMRNRYWRGEQLLALLSHLKQRPTKMILGSALFSKELGGSWPNECGIVKPNRTVENSEHYEVLFRINAAVMVNRFISRALSSACRQVDNSWTLLQQDELRTLSCPQSEERIDVVLVGLYNKSFDPNDDATGVFDASKFNHLSRVDGSPWMNKYKSTAHWRYFTASENQSSAISSIVDPDFLMGTLVGPFDACFCCDCTDEESLDPKSKKKFVQLKQRRKDGVQAIKKIITEVAAEDNERVYDVLEHLRHKGHHVPTEDDLLEYLEANSTFERVEILDRLNREKTEKEAWMLES